MPPSTVLLTGVTGFIGGATTAELLTRQPSCRVLALARGETRGIAEQRVRQSLIRFLSPTLLDETIPNLEVIHGDLTDPISLNNPRLEEVTHVLHLAANTSMRSVRTVRHANILGTLALAHRMRTLPGLKRFLYVGTAYICGANPQKIVLEDDYPRFDVQHLVEYTSSKAECEMLLDRTAPELPLVIARPSIVVGHTKLGCLPSSSIFWYYRALNLLRRVPAPIEKLKDIIPVDYTARALLHLLFKPKLGYRRYHISAGTAASVSWQEIDSAFANLSPTRQEEACRVVDFATLLGERDRLSAMLGPGDESTLLAVMEQFFKFGASGVEAFDNHRLLEEGMPAPPRFTSYLPVCASRPAARSIYQQMFDEL
jgi:nucleoside-diphosphate-sugar epimerase